MKETEKASEWHPLHIVRATAQRSSSTKAYFKPIRLAAFPIDLFLHSRPVGKPDRDAVSPEKGASSKLAMLIGPPLSFGPPFAFDQLH